MELDLFNFDFTESNAEMFSDERVLEKFDQLKAVFKERRNAYNIDTDSIPKDIIMYLDEFHKRGWIEQRKGFSGTIINIPDDYLDYHTADELIETYQWLMNRVMDKPDVNWYKNVLPVMNHGALPIRWKNEKVRQEVYRAKHEIDKEAAKTLGLQHFLDVPSARGSKMKPLDSKWARKHVLPTIAEIVIPITDFDEMEDFFRNHAFFVGRRDWFLEQSTVPIAPYPEFRRFIPSIFETACLCEAEDEKTVKLILDYASCAAGNFERMNPDIKYIYPEGWSMKEYELTLTDEDIQLIIDDQERLKRLHNH